MKAATISEIKQELVQLSPPRLAELCLRLAKYKKDNKELLAYLLFESQDETSYLNMVKDDMDQQFAAINHSNAYFAKKSLRKILRLTGKHIRYMASRESEVVLLLHFVKKLAGSPIPVQKHTALINLYQSQIKKIGKAIAGLHEDLQHDFLKEFGKLPEFGTKQKSSLIQLLLPKK